MTEIKTTSPVGKAKPLPASWKGKAISVLACRTAPESRHRERRSRERQGRADAGGAASGSAVLKRERLRLLQALGSSFMPRYLG